MALTKAEMAEALFDELGLNKREARELVDLFFEELRASLANGEAVKLSGFGNFDLRDKSERPGLSTGLGALRRFDTKNSPIRCSAPAAAHAY